MSSENSSEVTVFLAARKIESAAERAVYLERACDGNSVLRERVEKLLHTSEKESSFLEQPASGLIDDVEKDSPLAPTIVPSASGDNVTQAKDGYPQNPDSAVTLTHANQSVLKLMDATLDEVPRVSLREETQDDGPIQRPNSIEIPEQPTNSRYRLDAEIAQGGMGAILRGRDVDIGRDVAFKVLLNTHKDRAEVVQRFIEEAQISGQLQHPGIAPVYDIGQLSDERPFMTMKLVKGDTLLKQLADRNDVNDDRSKLIGIFKQICETMAYAHSRGVIHRDLKPANIMVGAFGEVQVMDWGLAKVLSAGGVADEKRAKKAYDGQSIIQTLRSAGSDSPAAVGSFGSAGTRGGSGSETQMGSVMGTPAYMPPEQALGEIDMLDQRTDVFGLGAILAEILTGKPPYVGEDATQLYRMASRGKLAECFERLDECGADSELIELTKECLEAEPADRPRDAGELAERVANYQQSVESKLRATEVERASESARATEQRKRFKVTLGLSTAALAILLAGIVATAWQTREAKRQTRVAQAARMEATAERDNARDSEQEAIKEKAKAKQAQAAAEESTRREEAIARKRRRELYAADMQLADQLYRGQNGEQKRIREILASWIPIDDQEDLREFSWRYQWTRLHGSASVSVSKCKGVAITPAGKMIVADTDGLHEVDNKGQKNKLIDWKLEYPWAWFSPDGRWVASNFESGVELYNIESGKKVLSLPQTRASFSANGKFFAAWKGGAKVDSLGEDEDAIPVWKLDGQSPTAIDPLLFGVSNLTGYVPQLPGSANDFELGSDGISFLRHNKGTIRANLNGDPKHKRWYHRNRQATCAWSPDGKNIASASSGIELRRSSEVAEWRTLEKLTFSSHGKRIQTLRFSPDGRVLATGGDDGTIDLWDVSAVVAAVERMGLPDPQRTDSKDSNIASISALPKPSLIRTIKAFPQFGGSISNLDTALSFSQDGSLLTALSSDGKAKLWDLTTVPGKYQMDQVTEDLYGWGIPANFVARENFVLRMIKLLPDEVVKGDPQQFDRLMAVFDSDKGKWQAHGGVETWYDHSMVAHGARGSEVRLKLENSEGEEYEATIRRLRQKKNQSTRSYSVAFAPDDKSVLVGDYTLGATRLNLESGEAVRYPQRGMSAAYSPDGRLVALDHAVGISIRDVKTDKELYRLDVIDRERNVPSFGGNLAFSPDGKYLAHVSGDRYTDQKSDLNVWRTSDFKKVGGGPLRQKEITMAALAFSPDSSRLFVGDYDGVVDIWNTSDWTQEDSMVTVTNQISSLIVSSDGKQLVIGHWRDFTLGGSVRVFDLETKEFLHALGSSSASVSSLALSPDDRTLAVGRMDHNVVLWDMETGKRLQTIQAHSESVFGVAFSHNGNRLATLSTDGVLHFWDAKTCSEIEDDAENIDLLLMLGVEHWMQQRFVEGEKTFALALALNQESGHLSKSRLTALGRDTRGWMYSWNFWPTLKEATGNWPSFQTQPPEEVGAKIGEHVTLNAETTEGDWSYQWFHNENPIEGATSPSLEIANISAADFGCYRLEVLGQKMGPLYQRKCVATTLLFDERDKVLKGHLLRKVFLHLFDDLEYLEASQSFLNDQPEMIGVVDSSATPTDFAIHYGQSIEGFVVPPKTGDYVFYVACGFESKLFLSSDASEENYKLIAQVKRETSDDDDAAGYMKRRAWGEDSNSVSEPIRLEAGKRYAIKGVMADGFKGQVGSGEGDHFAITWQMPGDDPPKPGDPPIPGEYLGFEIKPPK